MGYTNYNDDDFQHYKHEYYTSNGNNNQNAYFSSAYHANGQTPPPIQSLFLAIRSYIERKMLDSPSHVAVVTTFLVIIIFRIYRYEGQ